MGYLCPVWLKTEQDLAGHGSGCKGGAKKTMGLGPVVFFAEFISLLLAEGGESKRKSPRRGYPSRAFEIIFNIIFDKKLPPQSNWQG